MRKAVLALIVFLLVCPAVFADTIILKNRSRIKGKIIKRTDKIIKVAIANIGSLTFNLSAVDKIIPDDNDGTFHLLDTEKQKAIVKAAKERLRKQLLTSGHSKKGDGNKEDDGQNPVDEGVDTADNGSETVHELDVSLPEPTAEEQEEIEKLVFQLGHRKPGFRNAARQKIVDIWGEKALAALFGALDSETPFRVRNTAWVLGQIGDIRAIEPLVAAMHASDDDFAITNINNALESITDEDMGFDPEVEGNSEATARAWEKYLDDLIAAKSKNEKGFEDGG